MGGDNANGSASDYLKIDFYFTVILIRNTLKMLTVKAVVKYYLLVVWETICKNQKQSSEHRL